MYKGKKWIDKDLTMNMGWNKMAAEKTTYYYITMLI